MHANRRFLLECVKSGLELGTITAEDVLRHITPEILAHHLPVTLKARLLEACLAAERMTPTLVVETLGAEVIAEHTPLAALWACVADGARRLVGAEDDLGSSPGLPALEATTADARPAGKLARPPSVRMPGRISALSPRSRTTSAPRNGAARPESSEEAAFGDAASHLPAEPDFDISEDDDVLGARRTRDLRIDDETRPDDVSSGRKL